MTEFIKPGKPINLRNATVKQYFPETNTILVEMGRGNHDIVTLKSYLCVGSIVSFCNNPDRFGKIESVLWPNYDMHSSMVYVDFFDDKNSANRYYQSFNVNCLELATKEEEVAFFALEKAYYEKRQKKKKNARSKFF